MDNPTNFKGLSDSQVKDLRQKYGANELVEIKDSTLIWILKKFLNPITIMIEFALILSFLAHKTEDFVIITILLLVNVGIEMWQEKKASNALEALKETLTPTAVVLRNNSFVTIPARELVPGDIIKIVIGDIVPADVKIISNDIVEVDQASITGESLAVEHKKEDTLYATSIVQKGSAYAEVIAIGSATFIGKSAELVKRAEIQEESHFQKAIINIGKFLAVLSATLIILTSIALWYKGDSLIEILQFALVLAVASIPVALPAVLSVTMAVGASALTKYKAVVANFKAVEELAGVDTLCVDKTGTLTKNELSITQPITYNNESLKTLFTYAILASEINHKNNIELAIGRVAKEYDVLAKDLKQIYTITKFISFTPSTKSTEAFLTTKDDEKFSIVMGAPQIIANSLTNLDTKKQLEEDVAKLAKDGLRSLAIIKKTNNTVELVGLLPMIDPPREDSKTVISAIRNYNIQIKMITGDNSAIARFIGKILNLGTNVKNTQELNSTNNIEKLIHSTNIFAEVVPEDKYNIIDSLQKNGHIVAMTGDGVNDAPALKKADIGIAVSGASPAARSAADVVLTDPGLSTIKIALEHARQVFARMQGYATFRIAETVRVVFFVSLSVFFFGFTPIPAIMIVLLALLNDIPVMAMAYDNAPVNKDPVRWDLYETITVSSVLGIAGLISSFLLLYILQASAVPLTVIYTILFIKLDVSGHSTLYTTRTGHKHFWERPFPSLKFFLPAFGSRLVGTLLAIFGIFMQPISIVAILAIWTYSTIWFLFNDQIKVLTYKILYKFRKKNTTIHQAY